MNYGLGVINNKYICLNHLNRNTMRIKSILIGVRNVIILIFVIGTFAVCCSTAKVKTQITKLK